MKLLKGLEDGTKVVTSIYISSGNNKKELGAEQYLEVIANNYNCSKSDVIDHLSKLKITRLRPPKEFTEVMQRIKRNHPSSNFEIR